MQQALVQTVQYQAPRHKYEDRRLEITWFDFGIRIYIPFFFQLSCTTTPLWHSVPQNLCVQINFGGAIIIERKWHTRSLMSNMDPILDPANHNDLLEFAPCRVTETGMWVAKQKETTHSCPVNMFPLLLWRSLLAHSFGRKGASMAHR